MFSLTGGAFSPPLSSQGLTTTNGYGNAFVVLCVLLGLVTLTIGAEMFGRFKPGKNDKSEANVKLLAI